VLKIVGIILILFGGFSIYEAAHAVNQGRISPLESAGDYQLKRGDPDFDREVMTRRIGGFTLIAIGIGCLLIKRKGNEDEK
jgi:hypothetical protein